MAALILVARGRRRRGIPASAMLFGAATLFLLFWVPLWLLPWPETVSRFLSPFRVGLSEYKSARPIYFSGQDAVIWLACAWGAVAAFLLGLRVARGAAFRWFAAALLGGGIVLAAVMLVLYAAGMEIDPGVPHTGPLRLRGPFPNPDRFACWLGMVALVGVGVGLNGRRTGLVAAGSAVVVLLVSAILTASRGVFLGLVLLIFLAAVGLRRWRGSRPLLVPMMAAVTVLLLAGAWGLAGRLLALPQEINRLEAWKNALPMLRDFAAFGVGPGAFSRVYPWYQPPGFDGLYFHLHNEWLEVPLEVGVPGMILIAGLAWWVACAVRRVISGKARWEEPLTVCVAAAVLLPVFHSLFDFPLRQPANLFLWAALLGILAGRLNAYGAEEGAAVSPRACLVVGVVPVLMGMLVFAAGNRAAAGDEAGLVAAARLLPPGERYLAQAHDIAYKRLTRSRMTLEEAEQLNRLAISLVGEEAYRRFTQGRISGLEFEELCRRALEADGGDASGRLLRDRMTHGRFERINRLALGVAGEDAFVLFRAALFAAMRGSPHDADRLMRTAARAGRGYRGLNEKVAEYFWERFRLSGGRYQVFFRSTKEALDRLPGQELLWVERFLRAGIEEEVCRAFVGDDLLLGYARLLLYLGRTDDARLRFDEALRAGSKQAMPYLAGLMLAAGGETEGLSLWRRALESDEVDFSAFAEAVSLLDLTEPVFLASLFRRCEGNAGRLRWYLRQLRKDDHTGAVVAASALLHVSDRAGDVALYVRATTRAGERDAAWRVLRRALGREPASPVLWRCLVGLAQREPAADLLFRLAGVDTRRIPPQAAVRLADVLLSKGLATKAVVIVEDALSRGFWSRPLVATLAGAYRTLGLAAASDALGELLEAAGDPPRMVGENPAR